MSTCDICKRRLTRKLCNCAISNSYTECKDTIKNRNDDIVINNEKERLVEMNGVNINNNTYNKSTRTSNIIDEIQNSVLSKPEFN